MLQPIVNQHLFNFKHKNENFYKNIQRHPKLVAVDKVKQTRHLRVVSQQHIILIITIAWSREN